MEEISPSGVKRELHPIVERIESSGKHPFINTGEQTISGEQDSYGAGETGPRNMFNMGLEASQDGALIGMSDCRRDLPDRPSMPVPTRFN